MANREMMDHSKMKHDMVSINKGTHYESRIEAYQKLAKNGVVEQSKVDDIIAQYKTKIQEHGEFIRQNGVDPEEIENWKWKNTILFTRKLFMSCLIFHKQKCPSS